MVENAAPGRPKGKQGRTGTDFASAIGTADQDGSGQQTAPGARLASLAEDVKDLAGDAKEGAISAAETGKDALAEGLDDVAKAVHRSGEQLEGHQDWLAHLVERGADELSSLAGTLRTNDLRGLLSKLEDLARGQPALFAGAAMAAGFAAARLGKVVVAGASKADLPNMPEEIRDPK